MSKSFVCSLIDEVINDLNNWHPKLNQKSEESKQNASKNQPNKTMNQTKIKVYNPPYKEEYFDAHAHLDRMLRDKFKCKIKDFPSICNKYFNGNFGGAITIAKATNEYKPILELIYSSNEANKNIYATFGIHPDHADQWNDKIKQQIIDLVTADKLKPKRKIVAIGECGLDYKDTTNPSKHIQHKVFIEQIELSVQLDLPLVIHSRGACNDTIDIMRKYCPKNKLIHLHCLTDSLQFAEAMLNDFPKLKIGFTGFILSKREKEIKNTVKHVPLNRILLETDAPWFSSAMHPGTIPKIAKMVSKVHAINDVEKVLKQCRANTKDIYGV
eukprot:81694_1